MNAISGILYFVTLFLALAALLEWRRRRQDARKKVRRGLQTYVSGGQVPPGELEIAAPDRDNTVSVG
jgi:hypothetical protein